MSLAEDAYSLYELKRRFVRRQPSDGIPNSFHLVIASQADGVALTACSLRLAASQVAEDLLDTAEPAPFCTGCRRGQAYEI